MGWAAVRPIPAGEMIRLWGERMAHRHDEIRGALRERLAKLQAPEGVKGMASTWIVSAISPPA